MIQVNTGGKGLDPDQTRQNIWADLGPNSLTLMIFLKKMWGGISRLIKSMQKLPSMQRLNIICKIKKDLFKSLFNYFIIFSASSKIQPGEITAVATPPFPGGQESVGACDWFKRSGLRRERETFISDR